MEGPKYPHITAKLIGEDGNAFNLMGIVTEQLRHNGVSNEERRAFLDEAISGSYDNLLQTCMKWVNVE